MSENYAIIVNGLSGLDALDALPANITVAARQAVNKTIERARAGASREIREQVDFSASYLSPAGGRLSVTKKAQGDDLEAVITGRSRPTSLARFSRGSPRRGVRVQVQPGLAKFLPRAFLINLRAGTDPLDTRSNTGLAIRLPEGKEPSAAYKPKQLGRGLWLLYGPAVDQVFRTVAEDIAPDALNFLETEFTRLLELN